MNMTTNDINDINEINATFASAKETETIHEILEDIKKIDIYNSFYDKCDDVTIATIKTALYRNYIKKLSIVVDV